MTGITEADVKRAQSFPEVLDSLAERFLFRKSLCCTWGNDAELIASSCQTYGRKTPLRSHLDLSRLFQGMFLLKQTPGLGDAVKMMGLKFDGVPHGALADARNTAHVHAAMIRRMRREPELISSPGEQPGEVPQITSFGHKLLQALASETVWEKEK
jgi:inhibitor of KinA sporulation pathway (predicted exonuclease)